MTGFLIRIDDLETEPPRRLIAAHLAGMHENSPPESVHALDLRALTAPGITVWSAWRDDHLVGIGALAQLDAARGELKSMRVDDRFRGTGAGRALLRHIVAEARARGIRRQGLAPPALAVISRRRSRRPAEEGDAVGDAGPTNRRYGR